MRTAAKNLIKRFNELYPVGSQFKWRPVASDQSPYQLMTVRFPAYDMNGQAVAFANEKSGCISISDQFVDYRFKPEQNATNENNET
jgi:hypothetical protein